MKISALLTLAMLTLLVKTSIASEGKYNPQDVERLKATSKCPSCNLSGASLSVFSFNEIDINHANISRANFANTRSQCGNFNEILGTQSDFYGADLTQATFKNAVLVNTRFLESNLSQVDFSGADLAGAELDYANLTGSNISAEQLHVVKSYCRAIMPDGHIHECPSNKKSPN